MGFTTILQVLNDGMDQIKKHPEEFAAAVVDNYYDGGGAGVGCHVNMVEVLRSEHADSFQLAASHQNMLLKLSAFDRETLRIHALGRGIVRDMIHNARTQLDLLEAKLDEEDAKK